MINSDDSLGYSSPQILQTYQRINERYIQDSIERMMQPLTIELEFPEKLTKASLQKLPLIKQSIALESGSMRSDSTCMASDIESMSSARNSICSDHPEECVMPVPPMPQNKWQRKHNRFVLGALQLQKQVQQESYYYPRSSSIIQPQISICDCCQVSVCVCANTTMTTTTSTTNSFSNNYNHEFKHHEKSQKPKKRVTFALDIDVAGMPQKEKFSWPTTWLSAPKAKVATLCY